MRIYLSSCYLRVSPQVLLGLKCFDKICFVNFTVKSRGEFAHAEWFIIGCTYYVELSELFPVNPNCISLERRNILLSDGMYHIWSNLFFS